MFTGGLLCNGPHARHCGGGAEKGQEDKPGSLPWRLNLLKLREAVGRQNCVVYAECYGITRKC